MGVKNNDTFDLDVAKKDQVGGERQAPEQKETDKLISFLVQVNDTIRYRYYEFFTKKTKKITLDEISSIDIELSNKLLMELGTFYRQFLSVLDQMSNDDTLGNWIKNGLRKKYQDIIEEIDALSQKTFSSQVELILEIDGLMISIFSLTGLTEEYLKRADKWLKNPAICDYVYTLLAGDEQKLKNFQFKTKKQLN